MNIREADEDDLGAMLGIYNQVVASSTAIFRDTPMTADEYHTWWQARTGQGYPVLVAEDDDAGVLGFATFGDFRAWPGYRFTVEHSVHVRDGARGRGIGTSLMRPLIERAAALGKHVMLAGVDADNAPSLRFHERLGFTQVAHLHEVGYKFDRWLDLIFLQRMLPDRLTPRP